MKKSFFSLVAVAALVVGATVVSVAQVPGGGGPVPGGGGPGGGANAVPIDGGASALLAGGVAYAVRQIRARRKKA